MAEWAGMRAIRWTTHALRNLADREIPRDEAERTLALPELIAPGQPGRRVLMRRYLDSVLRQHMLLRIIIEETQEEVIVVTLYKTSQIDRYLRGPTP